MIDITNPIALDSKGQTIAGAFNLSKTKYACQITFHLKKKARVKEIVLFSGKHGFSPDTRVYADGYQKLSQYCGTFENLDTITGYTDKDHYKMPQVNGFKTAYNYALIGNGKNTVLIGAASCHRFRTEIRLNARELQIVQCLENSEVEANEAVRLEDLVILKGEKNDLLKIFAKEIQKNHPLKQYSEMPVGWCSWYCIGPNISEKDIFENLAVIKEKTPALKYIQIDDGFQPFMGDWLETSNKFNRPMKDICNNIKESGFEPAIWLAPFIASPGSRLLREHPDYFIQDESGNPLCSKGVTFSGWRDGPWYFLDGTNPDTQAFIYETVHEIYQNWGVKYFKLDANVWGALPFGIRHDKNATAIEAYRRGMEAVWRGVENQGFILGCNAPMWASLGLVSGMRVTNDVVRNIRHIANLTEQCFHRNWMHKTLWVNDPDCLLMAPTGSAVMDPGGVIRKSPVKKRFYKLNNIYVRASGGMILSGDYTAKYTQADVEWLQRILNTDYTAAEFDDNLEIGTLQRGGSLDYFIFNRGAVFKKYHIPVPNGFKATDLYENKLLKEKNGIVTVSLFKYGCTWIQLSKK